MQIDYIGNDFLGFPQSFEKRLSQKIFFRYLLLKEFHERTTLVENNKVVSNKNELVEIFGKYFGNIVQNLVIDGLTNTSSDNDAVTIRQAIEKYQNHPSIKVIRENIDTTNNFSFELINPECISKIINNLDTSKGDTPTKIIKDIIDLFHILFLQALIML